MDYLISVDWVQFSCTLKGECALEAGCYICGKYQLWEHKPFVYEVARARELNPMYSKAVTIALRGFALATFFFEPRPTTIPRESCALKMSNRLLYSGNWAWYARDIVEALGVEVRGLSRVDLCCDFHHFENGLTPVEFIQHYLYSGPYSEFYDSYVRVGRNKYCTIGEKSTSEKLVDGVLQSCSEHFVDYLRFGSRSSGVCVYLYNKSRELLEKYDKPYITELWKKGGLLMDEDQPIYRLEISVSASALGVKKKKCVEDENDKKEAASLLLSLNRQFVLSKLALDDIATQELMENAFWAYCHKYFRFKVVGEQKMKHNWEDVELFDRKLTTTLKPYRISRPLMTGVSATNAAHTLQKVLNEVRDLTLTQQVSIDNAISVLQQYARVADAMPTKKQIHGLIELLREGYDFEEIGRMRIISTKALDEYKQMIKEYHYHELRRLLDDSGIAAAYDEYQAVVDMIKEDAPYILQYEQQGTKQK